jgi:hypothetical protein
MSPAASDHPTEPQGTVTQPSHKTAEPQGTVTQPSHKTAEPQGTVTQPSHKNVVNRTIRRNATNTFNPGEAE